MRSRGTRIAGSLALVVASYWLYALAVVPWIEPSVALAPSDAPASTDLEAIERQQARRIDEFRSLFPPGSWELENPKILEADGVKLLLRDYTNLGDGRVELTCCTMIFLPEGDPADLDRRNQAIVLQAPEGAMLEFSEPLELARARIGRLVRGELRGQVTIRGQGKSPGPEDDLWIVTRQVALTQNEIKTSQDVDFRYGASYGRGADLRIKFLPAPPGKGSSHGPNMAGIESFQLNRLEQLHLETARGGLLPGQPSKPGPKDAKGVPVEVTCQGPFRFDLVQQLATFVDRVDVMQIHPQGPSDHLSCELLSIYFSRARGAEPPGAPAKAGRHKAAGQFDLEPRRIHARGSPVVLIAPSEDLQARGESLEYDLYNGRVAMDGRDEAYLRHGANQFQARNLWYEPGPDGQLGLASAQGPGQFAGQMANRPDQALSVGWSETLRLLRHEGQPVLWLSGEVDLRFAGVGHLRARQIWFWLREASTGGPDRTAATSVRPDRMLAQQDVRIDSPQLSGTMEEMRVWFEEIDPPKPKGLAAMIPGMQALAPAAAMAEALPGGARVVQRLMSGPADGWEPSPSGQALPPTANAAGPVPTSPAPPAAPPQSSPPASRFDVSGRLLRARVGLSRVHSDLLELVLEGDVRLLEKPLAPTNERSLSIVGQQVHVIDGNKPGAVVTVIGEPAHVEARELGLTGANINLNRGNNLLWIEGPGRMTMPVSRSMLGQDLAERPSAAPAKQEMLEVQWQDGMSFDGEKARARFEGRVSAVSGQQRLETRVLEVAFRQPLRFNEVKAQTRPEAEKLLCSGGVSLESRTANDRGQPSLDRMSLGDLAVHLATGAITGSGPGWMSSVRRNTGKSPLQPPGSLGGAPGNPLAGNLGVLARRPTGEEPSNKLVYVNVRFHESIRGNFRAREMAFHERVRVVYGPVQSWEEQLDGDRPDLLGPEAIVMDCDRLTLVDMPAPAPNQRAMELEAVGNTAVLGKTFTARGARMTYSEGKGLLVLEGDGRNDAELFRQELVGGPRAQTSARKIFFWPRTEQVRVEGARSFESGALPQSKPR